MFESAGSQSLFCLVGRRDRFRAISSQSTVLGRRWLAGWGLVPCVAFFAGIGASTSRRLSKAVAAVGLPMFRYELADGPASDLAKTIVPNSILADIRSGIVKLVWMGLPGTTFSRARRGFCQVRRGPRDFTDAASISWGSPHLNQLEQHTVDVLASFFSNWTPLVPLVNKCRGRRGLCGATGQPP